MSKVRKKTAIKRTKDMDDLSCPRCESLMFQRHGKQKNGTNRYICTYCGKRFNQNTGHNELTKKELIVNDLVKYLFNVQNEYFITALKDKSIVDIKKIVRDISKKALNENVDKKPLQLINIDPSSKKVAMIRQKERETREYLINENSEDFLLFLREGYSIYMMNKIPDAKCKNLMLETSEYVINIHKKTDEHRVNDFYYKKFLPAKEAQKERKKSRKEKSK